VVRHVCVLLRYREGTRSVKDFRKGGEPVPNENCFISELTVFELMYGAENSDNPKKSLDAVDKFVKGLSIIPIMTSVKHYVKTKVFLRKNGTPMHDEFDNRSYCCCSPTNLSDR